MSQIANLGRFLFAISMIIFGVFHFVNTRSLQNVVPAVISGQTFWVYLTGASLFAAGVSIIFQKQVQLISNPLTTMLLVLVLVFFVYLPIAFEGDQLSASSILKDISLAGGAFFVGHHFKKK